MAFVKLSKKSQSAAPIKHVSKGKKIWRVFSIFLIIMFIAGLSFAAYVYTNGSKIFEGNAGSLARALKGDKLEGQDLGRINFLFLGRGGDNHPGGLLTDSIMVVSLDTKEDKVALLSVPRDLLVPIKNHGQDKINTAYSDGYNEYLSKNCKKKKQTECREEALAAGADLTKGTLSDVLGIPIHYYVTLDFEGFKEFIDKIGGVDVYVDKAIYDPLYPDKNMKGYEPFSIKVGQQHMSGDIALKYSRSRETSSDFDRSRRQQQVISAIKDKTLTAGVLANPKKIVDLLNVVSDHLRTDLSPSELKTLSENVNGIDKNKMITKVLSNGNGGLLISDSSSGTFYLKPKAGNFEDISKLAQNIFSDTPDMKQEAAKIEISNGSKTSGLGGRLSSQLQDAGLTVSNVASSKETYKTTTIFDYSNGTKKATINYLKEKLNANVIEKKDATKDCDILIIIGDDYKDSSVSKSANRSS